MYNSSEHIPRDSTSSLSELSFQKKNDSIIYGSTTFEEPKSIKNMRTTQIREIELEGIFDEVKVHN